MSDDRDKPRIRNALDARRTYGSSSQGGLQFTYDESKLKEENKYKLQGRAFPDTVNGFNWGACILGPIWGLFNNSPIACLSIVLNFIPYMGFIMGIIFSIYCGAKGNEWAWENKQWSNIQEFHRVQRNWAAWAIGIEMAIIIGLSTAAFLAIQIIGRYGSESQLDSVRSILGVY